MYRLLDQPKIKKCNEPNCYFDTVTDKALSRHYYYSHPSISDVKSYVIAPSKLIKGCHVLYGVKKLLDFKEAVN
jgi:hypothetical protein